MIDEELVNRKFKLIKKDLKQVEKLTQLSRRRVWPAGRHLRSKRAAAIIEA